MIVMKRRQQARKLPRVNSKWVGLLGTSALIARYESSKAKYGWETDSKQVVWRKDEKDKRVKRSEIVEKESVKFDGRTDGYHGASLRSSYRTTAKMNLNTSE